MNTRQQLLTTCQAWPALRQFAIAAIVHNNGDNDNVANDNSCATFVCNQHHTELVYRRNLHVT